MKELLGDIVLMVSLSGLFLIVGAALIVAGSLTAEYLAERWRRKREQSDESDD